VILGIGIDLLDTTRVERELAHKHWSLEDGVFTANEISHCSGRRNPAPWFAACFAAKEAALKALGFHGRDIGILREVEVKFLDDTQELTLHKRLKARSTRLGVSRIRLSLAQSSKNAGAIVVLES
jgi:holo-[acyl-carrier protein] synthase